MDRDEIKAALDEYAVRGTLNRVSRDKAISAAAQQTAHMQPPTRSSRRNLRLAQAATALTLAAVISLLIYALVPLAGEQATTDHSGQIISQPTENPLSSAAERQRARFALSDEMWQRSVKLNQSQSLGGYTVRLTRAYLDQQVVVILYEISDPMLGERTIYDKSNLTDAAGTVFTSVYIGDITGEDNGWLHSSSGYGISGLNTEAATVSLKLAINLFINISDQDWLTAHPDGRGDLSSRLEGGMVAGPFNFDLSLPLVAEVKTVTTNQTVVANGHSLTLNKVVITPGQTRLYLTSPEMSNAKPEYAWFGQADFSNDNWATSYSADGKDYHGLQMVVREQGAMPLIMSFSFYGKAGTWQVKINQLHGLNPDRTSVDSIYLFGPWTFTVNVPAQ